MTPHHLHALAAAHQLHEARILLAVHVDREARHNTGSLLDAAPLLRSSSAFGIRHGVGGHGDPTSGLLLASERPVRVSTWADRQETADRRLSGIAAMLRIDDPTPLGRIIELIPRIQPGTAAVLHRHLADEDALVRGWVEMAPLRRPLVGVDCPACGHRELYVQVAGPEDAWTVMCAGGWDGQRRNPCLCVGVGCRCGMPGAVEGVAHIWPRHVVLGAVAGAAPTQ